MSDSLMPFQPAIDEPSNILPSWKKFSSTKRVGTVTCCSLPIVSVNRRSANFASFSAINFRTSAGVISVLAAVAIHSVSVGVCLTLELEFVAWRSEFVNALQGKAGLAVRKGVAIRAGAYRSHQGCLIGLVVTSFDAQLETFCRSITKCQCAFLELLWRAHQSGNESFLVVHV